MMTRYRLLVMSRTLMLCIIYVALGGCQVLTTYAISRPISESPEINISWQGRIKLRDTVVLVSPANSVEIRNGTLWLGFIPAMKDVSPNEQYFWPGYYQNDVRNPDDFNGTITPGFFIFEIFFDAGKRSIEFAPGDTILHYRKQNWRAINTYELVKKWEYTGSILGHAPYEDSLCGNRKKGPYPISRNPLIVLEKPGISTKIKGLGVPEKMTLNRKTKYCLALEFPVNPPDPRRDQFEIEINYLRIDDENMPIRIKYVPDTTTHGRS